MLITPSERLTTLTYVEIRMAKPNRTALRARFVEPSLKPRREPAGKPTRLHNRITTTLHQVRAKRIRRRMAAIPCRHTSDSPPALPPPLAALFDIRLRLEVAMAAATICSAALKPQHANSDQDAALVLQRCVCDALSVQIDRLGAVHGKLSTLAAAATDASGGCLMTTPATCYIGQV